MVTAPNLNTLDPSHLIFRFVITFCSLGCICDRAVFFVLCTLAVFTSHLLVPTAGEPNDPYACGDASLEAHVDDGDAQLELLPTSAWMAIPPNNECQGEIPINHVAQRGLARNVAKRRCPRPTDTCGLRVGCAHRGFRLKWGQ